MKVNVCPVKSEYWGEDITVAGLITSEDLIKTIKDIDCDVAVVPSVMLRPYSEDFLDGKTLDYVKSVTGKNIYVQQDVYSLNEVIELLKTV